MSRRRRGREGTSSLAGIRETLPIVCTGRATHDQLRLGRVEIWADGRINVDLDDPAGPEPETIGLGTMDPHQTTPLKCRRCGRDEPLTQAKLEIAVGAIRASGVSRMDVSALWAIFNK